ncbi:hypothetical protein BDZ89DRAFT_1070484 [Hymenopellis radicata]|nr:hypothetical protein BDZ89DRAFT_1070484 [Hymenopellis radicata]
MYVTAFNIVHNILNTLTHFCRPSASTGLFGRVPQELLDLVIFHLADDRTTLLSCALVHSTWTSVSRYHLRPLILVVSSEISRTTEIPELLRPSCETLSASITGIKLVGYVPFYHVPTNNQSPDPGAFYTLSNEVLHVLKAKHLTLCSGTVANDPSLVRSLAQYFPDLSDLKVTCASYVHITGLMRALSGSFPRLAELGVVLVARDFERPDAPLPGLRELRLGLPCLRSLRVVGWNNDLVRWLGDNVVGTLERLDLESACTWSTGRVEEAITLIQRNKKTLRDLRLSFWKPDVPTFDLSGLIFLENLEVTSVKSDMELVLEGLRLPRSLRKVYLRIVVCVAHCTGTRVSTKGEVVLEGEKLKGALRMY